jgi:hypothetical protein
LDVEVEETLRKEKKAIETYLQGEKMKLGRGGRGLLLLLKVELVGVY